MFGRDLIISNDAKYTFHNLLHAYKRSSLTTQFLVFSRLSQNVACRAVNFVTLDDPTSTNPKHAKPLSISSGGKSVACRAVATPATLLVFMHEEQRKLFVRFVQYYSSWKGQKTF